jgi:hypothetical protein|nr:MAG TPA: hypothetical protein [Caudoviricetes sp.]
MEINRKLLDIFCHTQFDSKFKYNFRAHRSIEMTENINSKQMSLRYIVGRKPTLFAKVFIQLDSIIVRKRIIKNIFKYKYNVINIYNLYILSREYMRVNK